MLIAVYAAMKHDPRRPDWPGRDIFILSKGHAALALYCTLAHYGYFSFDDILTFGAFGSSYGCHADRTKVRGVEVSTGSLGHGIGLAVGMALAFKIGGSGRKVYCLIGDGEANEGTVWESVMVASSLKLNQLTILYDNNGSQVRCLPIPNPAERFASFGCEVAEVNGHDVGALKAAFDGQRENARVVVANTVKGFGCKTLVDDMFAWHRRSPTPSELEILLRELNETTV
jgi:transketolase